MKEFKKLTSVIGILGVVILMMGVMAGCQKGEITDDGNVEVESASYETLSESNAEKFAYSDLVVNKLKMGMTEADVKAILGEPANYYDSKEVISSTSKGDESQKVNQKETQKVTQKATQAQTQKVTQAQTQTSSKVSADEIMDERIYAYNDLSLVFMPVEGSYRLCAAASASDTDIFARGIRVGDTKDRILELFYRDRNCLNNNLMTEDKETIIGKYLYGNNTMDDLEAKKISDKLQYGIINFNGYPTFEAADSYMIEFTYFEMPYKGQYANYNDDFAQMAFDIDSHGKITGIRWYYYPETNAQN